MRFPILILTIVTLIQNYCFGQIENKFDTTKLNEFSQNITTIEKDFADREAAILGNIDRLNKQLDSLKGTKNLVNRVEALEKKQTSVEELNTIALQKDIELNKVRYEAGVLVLKDIIQLLKALKSQYSTLDFQQSYNDLSNPNTYPEYNNNIDYLKKKLVKNGLTLPDLNLNNSILNVAYSITRSIVSEQPDKQAKVNEIVCILDFSSRASQELMQVKNDLKYLQFLIDKMITNYNELFTNYTSIIGYTKTFNDYLTKENDDLSDKSNDYFQALSKKEPAEKDKDLKNLKFQLRKVADAYLEYEIYIRQGLAYYEKFELIMNDIKPNCNVPALNQKIEESYNSVKQKLDKAKTSFEDAFKGKIKQTYIKQLTEG